MCLILIQSLTQVIIIFIVVTPLQPQKILTPIIIIMFSVFMSNDMCGERGSQKLMSWVWLVEVAGRLYGMVYLEIIVAHILLHCWML